MSNDTIGIITANYATKSPSVLTEHRPCASMPFLGRYRLIDFALSNMVNCGIRTVGVIMPYNYRSLIDHISNGSNWDLSHKKAGLFILPGSAFGTSRTGPRFLLRDIARNQAILRRNKTELVILTTANFAYNMDYNELAQAYRESDADIMVLAKQAPADDADIVRLTVDEGRVKGINQGVKAGETAFLDCFVIRRELLLQMLDWHSQTDYLDLFEAIAPEFDRVNVQAYAYEGRVEPVFNKDSFFTANMDLLDPRVAAELFPEDRPIRTKPHDNAPAKFETGSSVKNSRVSGSCRIFGSVSNSVLGREVIVEKGASVESSIIMQGCVLKAGSHVEYAIIDRGNVIPANTELRGTAQDLIIRGKPEN